MEAKCYLKYQRYGTRKVGEVLKKVAGKSLYEAETILKFMSKRPSDIVHKAVMSAGANLSVKLGKKVDLKSTWVKEAYSCMGSMKALRRFNAGPMGRAMPFKRSMCHITVIVSDSKGVK
ncbi:MAG: uL22 family ribosomal protein [Elusimicrobiota bacterium]|nr:uL22 family ribosomal protein [Elusimicrobiota bacterium]